MASTFVKTGYKKTWFFVKKLKISCSLDYAILFKSLAYGTNILKGMYGETLDSQC